MRKMVSENYGKRKKEKRINKKLRIKNTIQSCAWMEWFFLGVNKISAVLGIKEIGNDTSGTSVMCSVSVIVSILKPCNLNGRDAGGFKSIEDDGIGLERGRRRMWSVGKTLGEVVRVFAWRDCRTEA